MSSSTVPGLMKRFSASVGPSVVVVVVVDVEELVVVLVEAVVPPIPHADRSRPATARAATAVGRDLVIAASTPVGVAPASTGPASPLHGRHGAERAGDADRQEGGPHRVALRAEGRLFEQGPGGGVDDHLARWTATRVAGVPLSRRDLEGVATTTECVA